MTNVLKHKIAARNVSTISLMALKAMAWKNCVKSCKDQIKTFNHVKRTEKNTGTETD
jgi:hypothetical protein